MLLCWIVLVLSLGACAETEPARLPTTAPSSPSPTVARPTSPATAVAPAESATSEPWASTSPWPGLLHELNFGVEAGNSYGPGALAVDPDLDLIYVRTHSRDSDAPGLVAVLSRSTGLVQTVLETGPDSYGQGGLLVDADHARLLAINADESSCSVFDTTTHELLTTLQGANTLALTGDGGRLYVAGQASLRVLDASDYALLQESPISYAPRFLALDLDEAQGRLYVAYEESGSYSLVQFDTLTLREVANTELPGRPQALAVDPKRGVAYLTLSDGERNLLWTLKEDGQVAEEQVLGEWTQRTLLSLDRSGDRLFLTREAHQNHGVVVLDLQSGKQDRDIALDLAPTSIHWDASGGRLLISHTYDDKIQILDVDTGQTQALHPTALDLVDVAVDAERGHLLVTDSGGQLHVLDALGEEQLASLPAAGRIAVDSPHARFYTGGEGADRIRVFDAIALEQVGQIDSRAVPVADAFHGRLYLVQRGIYLASLETMTITSAISDTLPQQMGLGPNTYAVAAQVDPGSGRVYAIVNNGVPGSNSGTHLYVYESDTYQKVLTDTERSPAYLDVDPTTGRAYVSRIHMAGRSTSLLLNGRQYSARLEAVFGAVRVDTELKRVYLSVSGEGEGYLLVLDADNLDVLGSTPIPGGYSLRCLDSQRHLLYLATSDGRVQIWSALGGELASPTPPQEARPSPQEIFRLFRGPGDKPIFAGSLYQSEDDGRSWYSISNGLPQRGMLQVVASPQFSRDGILFAATFPTGEGLGIWKSETAGWSWRMASRGLSDLAVHSLAISPSFAQDQTLFATTRLAGLFRTTDGGETWTRLTERYQPPTDFPPPAGAVVLSPTYDRDRTVFVVHDGLWRSQDGGDTWKPSFSDIASLAFSPQFAADGTLFGWSGSAGVLRSTDWGETWQAASTGLTTSGLGSSSILVSPDFPSSRTLYTFWSGSPPEEDPQLFRSVDAAQTWQRLEGPLPRAATPFLLDADGSALLALDEAAQLIRWTIEDQNWLPAALPTVQEIAFQSLVLSPDFSEDRTLFAQSKGAGILRSTDAGRSWSDTEFPARVTHGLASRPVAGPASSLFLGTSLGLYRFADGEGWSLVQGGLPSGLETSSPLLIGANSMVVLSGNHGDDQTVFLSTDEGRTWSQPLPALPFSATPEEVRLSPAFAFDHAAFLAPNWGQAWRSRDSGEWHTFGPGGEQGIAALHVSPDFDIDALLFIQLQDTSLWRSTDSGDRWTEIRGPWAGDVPTAVSARSGHSLGALTFSPAFVRDRVLLTQAGKVLYRSIDLGASWSPVLDFSPTLAQVAFSPEYDLDGTLYLLWDGKLFRSENRGQQWQGLPVAPWADLDDVTLLLSPTFAQEQFMLAWSFGGRIFQSVDGGLSWSDITAGLPPTSIRQLIISTDHASDRLLFLLPHSEGLYQRAGDSPWLPITETAPQSRP